VREGTAAADLPDRVPVHVAAERSRELREIGVSMGSAYAARRAGTGALVAVETKTNGLTGDYLRVRVTGSASPGSLVRARLSGAPNDLRAAAGATGRSALPVLAASAV